MSNGSNPSMSAAGGSILLVLIVLLAANGCGGEKVDEFVVRYVLPASQIERTSPATPAADGVSDPTKIVYDQARIEAHVRWILSGLCTDGVAEYTVLTPEGPRKFNTGLDEVHLGRVFRAEDLVSFLERRLDGEVVEKEFHISDPEIVTLYRKRTERHPEEIAARLSCSPWERDTAAAIRLLSRAKYAPARTLFNRLTKDRSEYIRNVAVLALGRIAAADPKVVDDLKHMLDDAALRGQAVSALGMAGKAAVPVMIQALDHPDEAVRNAIAFQVPWMEVDAGKPVLLVALQHADPAVRLWAVSVLIDMQGRRMDVSDRAIVDALILLLKDEDATTRRKTAIALLNFGPAAVSALPALRVAVKDPDSTVRRYAAKAIKAIEGNPAHSQPNGQGSPR